MKIDVLAIGAHPDDIELSCSAAIAKLVLDGKQVGILDLTEGELGTRGTKLIRKKEAQDAAKILGVSFRTNLELGDGNISVTKTNVIRIVEILRMYKPEILLFPHWLERHPDHEHSHRLCREAWFYSGLEKIHTTVNGMQQEPHRPRNYFHYMQKYEFVPSFIVDVTDAYHLKTESLQCFKSQFYNPDSIERETLLSTNIFLDSIRSRDVHHGSLIDVHYGEPFYSIAPVGISSFFSLL
jgi:bacillithiol biosynthesis deacetylase BshB1